MKESDGGLPARRALLRWAVRLVFRERRQHLLVVALIAVGTGGALFASTATFNFARPSEGQFGRASHRLEVNVSQPELLDAYLASAAAYFGEIDPIRRRSAPIPGSVQSLEVRAQHPGGTYGAPMLRLRAGRYPDSVDEVAVTDGAARLLGTRVGATVSLDGEPRVVVGRIENPGDLDDEFILEPADAGAVPDRVTVLVHTSEEALRSFRPADEPGTVFIAVAQDDQTVAAAFTLTIATLGMALIGLMAAAGFVVIAQRRQRQLAMLASVGATPRQLRFVLLVTGLAIGIISAIGGVLVGLGTWVVLAPGFEAAAGHRLDRLDIPTWLIPASAILAIATATGAAWWPARMAAKVPIVQALSGRPERPTPTRRSALSGLLLLAAATVCLGLGIDPGRDDANFVLVIAGVIATIASVVFMAAPAIRIVATAAGRLPLAVRLAIRDLARHRARSGAGLAAITVGLGIAVAVVVIAGAAEYTASDGNLSNRQLIAWVGDRPPDIHVPDRAPGALQESRTALHNFASALDGAVVVPLEVAVDPTVSEQRGTQTVRPLVILGRRVNENTLRDSGPVFVANTEVLTLLDIDPTEIDDNTILLTSGSEDHYLTGDVSTSPFRRDPIPNDAVQHINTPNFSSTPRAVLTEHGLDRGGWDTATAGWLIQTDRPLTDQQLADARDIAADAGLTIESRDAQPGLATLRTTTTLAGVALALGILAMTVGLLRTQATSDLRTLTAIGAERRTRRTLTATTAGTLAAIAVIAGTSTAYLALIAGYWPEADRLAHIPLANLAVIALATPTLATIAGWALAGREPELIRRQPLE